jgi:primosomal protein N' (replication factor Y)
VPGTFTYRVPAALNDQVTVGKRAIVQFGKKKVLAAIIGRVHEEIPKGFSPKYLLDLLDESPVVVDKQLKFWYWMKEYYLCNLGELMQAAMPSALKLSSETMLQLSDHYETDKHQLNENEFLIIEALELQQKITLSEVSKILGIQKVMPIIRNLIDRGLIVTEEELKEKFHQKKEAVVILTQTFREENALQDLMNQLEKRAYKQLELLLSYLSIAPIDSENKEVSVSFLLKKADASHPQLKALTEKGVFELSKKIVSRIDNFSSDQHPDDIELTESQSIAIGQIKTEFSQKDVVLLHGVTSSGKTELYIKLINENLKQGKQVLFLLPEIALTTQIILRLKRYFGENLGVYHSRYNPNERAEIWQKVLQYDPTDPDSQHQLIIGPRSALFLPFQNLGLIIVDEEHDQSYKQHDPAPRYQARDAALVLARIHGAKVLLGSATPSFESYFNAKIGKYGLVVLKERYSGIALPEIEIVNLREEKKRKTMQSHFSRPLMEEMQTAIENKEQVILFQNRRGFALRLECEACNWVPECRHCDVSLIYHKNQRLLRCHYCGYAMEVPAECPNCQSTALKMHGFGTEKVQEELQLLLPDARISRLDLDTTRSKFGFQQIIEAFGKHETDILTGTQMVTKGLDFDSVRIVGILNADNMLSYPDFRAHERSFQLMAQVAGRAGRKGRRGKVLIQTHQPHHPLLQDVVRNDYESLYERLMAIRKEYHYPPFYRLILIRLKHRDQYNLNMAANDLAFLLRKDFADQVLGPEFPMVSRIRNLYIKQILIKFDRRQHSVDLKAKLIRKLASFNTNPEHKSLIIQLDVDPQ